MITSIVQNQRALDQRRRLFQLAYFGSVGLVVVSVDGRLFLGRVHVVVAAYIDERSPFIIDSTAGMVTIFLSYYSF